MQCPTCVKLMVKKDCFFCGQVRRPRCFAVPYAMSSGGVSTVSR